MVKTIRVRQNFLAKFWHLEHSSSLKIDQFTAISPSKSKRAGRAKSTSHSFPIFKIYITFEGV